MRQVNIIRKKKGPWRHSTHKQSITYRPRTAVRGTGFDPVFDIENVLDETPDSIVYLPHPNPKRPPTGKSS